MINDAYKFKLDSFTWSPFLMRIAIEKELLSTGFAVSQKDIEPIKVRWTVDTLPLISFKSADRVFGEKKEADGALRLVFKLGEI